MHVVVGPTVVRMVGGCQMLQIEPSFGDVDTIGQFRRYWRNSCVYDDQGDDEACIDHGGEEGDRPLCEGERVGEPGHCSDEDQKYIALFVSHMRIWSDRGMVVTRSEVLLQGVVHWAPNSKLGSLEAWRLDSLEAVADCGEWGVAYCASSTILQLNLLPGRRPSGSRSLTCDNQCTSGTYLTFRSKPNHPLRQHP